jgi:hypothetical protein
MSRVACLVDDDCWVWVGGGSEAGLWVTDEVWTRFGGCVAARLEGLGVRGSGQPRGVAPTGWQFRTWNSHASSGFSGVGVSRLRFARNAVEEGQFMNCRYGRTCRTGCLPHGHI